MTRSESQCYRGDFHAPGGTCDKRWPKRRNCTAPSATNLHAGFDARMGRLHSRKIMEQVAGERGPVDVPFWRMTKVFAIQSTSHEIGKYVVDEQSGGSIIRFTQLIRRN